MSRGRHEDYHNHPFITMSGPIMQRDAIDITIQTKNRKLIGFSNPEKSPDPKAVVPILHAIYWHGEYWATVYYGQEGWEANRVVDKEELEAVGEFLIAWYE